MLICLASKRTRLNISELIVGIRYALRVGGKGERVVKQRQLDSCKVSPASKYGRLRARSSLSLPPNKQKVDPTSLFMGKVSFLKLPKN